jgi:hypothetical protein
MWSAFSGESKIWFRRAKKTVSTVFRAARFEIDHRRRSASWLHAMPAHGAQV